VVFSLRVFIPLTVRSYFHETDAVNSPVFLKNSVLVVGVRCFLGVLRHIFNFTIFIDARSLFLGFKLI
jgi:hypothetical protein